MDRGTRNLFALVLVVVLALAGGAALLLGGPSTRDPVSTGGSLMVGVIVAIDSAGLDDVRGFTLRRGDGVLVEFDLGELENAVDFPPGHLAEHQATADRVRVTYRDEGGRRVVSRIDDAS